MPCLWLNTQDEKIYRMNELDNIISLVAKRMEASESAILTSHSPKARKSRSFVCHIIREGFPHLMTQFGRRTNENIKELYLAADRAEKQIKENRDSLIAMNHIRSALSLPVIKGKFHISSTKRMFGFDYTEEEELEYQRILDEAPAFWERMSRIGKQPLEDGMVMTLSK